MTSSSHPPLRDEPGSWPVVESRDLHRDEWVVALREDRITVPDGSGEPFRRLVLEHPGAAIVLAVDDQPIVDPKDLHERIVCGDPGSAIALQLLRDERACDPIVAVLGEVGGRGDAAAPN